MKLETMRCIKAGLADGSNGINAKIAGLTLDGSDARPSNPTPYFDVDHKWLARRQVDDEELATIAFPALAVFQNGPLNVMDVAVTTNVQDATLQVVFGYMVNKQDSALAVRDSLYFNRALLRWINWFRSNDQTSGFRTKNGIIIRSVLEITQDDVHQDFGSANLIAATAATFRVRETSP